MIITERDYLKIAEEWVMTQPNMSGKHTIIDNKGRCVGYSFEYKGWKYTRIMLNKDEGDDDNAYIKESV